MTASRFPALTVGLFLAACGTAAPDRPPPAAGDDAGLEFLHERVVDVQARDDGSVWVGFERSARWYVVAGGNDEVAAAARDALRHGRPVHATVRVLDRGPKRPPGRGPAGEPPVLLRLAEDPDPRASR